MSRFLLQRKLMTFADRYSIRDEQGEDAYLARGQWMSIGKKIHVKDREEKEVALLQRKLGTLRPQFVITIPGLPEITVVRELVFLRVQYSVHILDWTVEGDVFHHDFYIRSGVKEIARIRKKWVANADQYSVEVLDDRDDLPVLLIVLAIDCSLLEARMATKISGAEK